MRSVLRADGFFQHLLVAQQVRPAVQQDEAESGEPEAEDGFAAGEMLETAVLGQNAENRQDARAENVREQFEEYLHVSQKTTGRYGLFALGRDAILLFVFGDNRVMGRYGTTDYPRYAKLGFFAGVAMFLIGGIGSAAGNAFFGPLPAWETTLLFDLELFGILTALFSPLVFGIVMPLTE